MLIMKYTIQKGNQLFDILYSHGVFLPPGDAVKAGAAAVLLSETFMQ